MTIPLLKTKLYTPPVRPGQVSRPRLIERLEEGLRLGNKLTLISAPAGFGKTTLVTAWLSRAKHTFTWLSLDEGDNDPVRFWSYVIAAIQAVHPEVGDEAHQIVSTPQLHSAELVVVSLLNDIAELTRAPSTSSGHGPSTDSGHSLVLVLDDYHVIEARQIHDRLNYLLENQPPNLHIVLITRVDPPLPLARLRAHGQLIEIRAADLQFSSGEATTLFNDVANLQLKPDQVAALHLRTEGWIVGLQLAALTLRGHSAYDTFFEHFTGSHQFILDYLTEEVLRALPDAQRQFLLRTSILDRFCAALCGAVTGDPASQQVLDKLRSSSLFLIPLDAGGIWFRYHHLFAEVLYALLKRDHPNEIDALHLKAATWFESEGYPGEAVDHAVRSGDMLQARERFLKHWLPVLHRGEVATVLRWLDAMPEEIEKDDPSISLARCWALFLSWQNSVIEPHLERANNAYERLANEGALSSAQQDQIAAELAMMRSVLARGRGEHAKSVAYAEEAARLVPQEMLEGTGTAWNMLAAARAGAGDFDGAIEAYEHGIALTYAVGNLVGAYGCTYGQAMYMLIQGRLTKAEGLCRSSINRAIREGHGDFPATGWLHIAMARIKLERGYLDEAERYLRDGLRIARPGGFSEAVRSGRYLRAHLAATRGDLDTATDILEETERLVNAMDEAYLTGELNREWLRLYIKAGDLDAAREKLQILDEKITTTQHANLLLWRDWLFPRLLCAEERYKEALAALDEAIDRARAGLSRGELVRLLVLQALALDALGDRIPARSTLREALALGAPGGYIWLWLSAGPGVRPLLRDMRADHDTHQTFHPYLDSLLDACQVVFGESSQPRSEELLDPLTPRELEIVRLICAGHSGPDIAKELVLAYNTVRKHISNIYSKLGVGSRSQAIARAHQLNLLRK